MTLYTCNACTAVRIIPGQLVLTSAQGVPCQPHVQDGGFSCVEIGWVSLDLRTMAGSAPHKHGKHSVIVHYSAVVVPSCCACCSVVRVSDSPEPAGNVVDTVELIVLFSTLSYSV